MNNKLDIKIFKMLLPKGILWRFGDSVNAFFEALVNRITEVRNYQDEIVKESSPFTAVLTITDWMKTYSIISSNDPLIDSKMIKLYASSFGGQSMAYFEKIIEAEYPDIKIKLLNDKTTISIVGAIYTRVESIMFQDFCEKLFPAYTLLEFNVLVKENFGQYGECGVAQCGVSECGYIQASQRNKLEEVLL